MQITNNAINYNKVCLIVLGFLVLVLICIRSKTSDTTAFDESSAYYNSKKFVLKILKAPTTATFEDPCSSCAVLQSDGTWVVNSYVDAQNSFGAMLRQNYECHLSYNTSNDIVTCLSVRLIPN